MQLLIIIIYQTRAYLSKLPANHTQAAENDNGQVDRDKIQMGWDKGGAGNRQYQKQKGRL